MPRINVNTIVNRNDDGGPEFTKGITIPDGGSVTVSSDINTTGVITATHIDANTFQCGIITSGSYIGDGSNLTGLPIVSAGKAIALKIVLDPLPFRS